jgi:hypothetical protein
MMSTPEHDPVARLQQAGFPMLELTEAQLAVFGALSAEEVALLIDIRERLDLSGDEVQAHGLAAGAGIF